jgi:hypothetical protein
MNNGFHRLGSVPLKWTPSLGQTTVTTTVSSAGNGTPSVASAQGAPNEGGMNMLALLALSGAVLVVTEALGLTHVRKWFSKTMGFSKK